MSEFGGADSISLRRIRRAMITARPEGDERSGTQLLLDAINDGELFIEGADSVLHPHAEPRSRKVIAGRGLKPHETSVAHPPSAH